MFEQDDLSYFRVREEAERAAAEEACNVESREIHRRLADHYADRVWALEEQACRVQQRRR